MNAQRNVKIGVLGMGIVGSELVSLLLKNKTRIAKETGMVVTIEKIFVRTMTKPRSIDIKHLPLTSNVNEVIDNTNIDIVCECMGGNGCDETNIYIQKALDNGKHVVMSSKKALAQNAEVLLRKAKMNNRHLKYDASVGGAIPIAKVIDQAFKGDNIMKIYGIFNATSNYIYSKMEINNQSFSSALKMAQNIGYAENDPSEDIDGIDSLNKLVILSMFSMNIIINPKRFETESFQNISTVDMKYAKDFGFSIKPIAYIENIGDRLEYKIGPCLIPNNHIVANTHNNFNSVIIEGENTGELGFYGQGAGAKPTASALFDDVINILKNPEPEWDKDFKVFYDEKLLNSNSSYYVRLSNHDVESKLMKIIEIFSDFDVKVENHIEQDNREIGLITTTISHKCLDEIFSKLKENDLELNSLLSIV
jgi:homoserine dehydrogenase